MIPVLKKIRLFNGLSPSQIRLILSICTSSRFAAGDSVCEVGTPSDGMYILISGELEVLSDADTRLAVIKPVTTVGEMGVVTRQDRSATVRAICDSSALAIGRQSFESILRGDKEMSAVIYRNIVEIMCHKLVQDNAKVRQIQEREWSLEQSLREKNRDLSLALTLLEERAHIPRGHAEVLIKDMRVSAPPRGKEMADEYALPLGEVA